MNHRPNYQKKDTFQIIVTVVLGVAVLSVGYLMGNVLMSLGGEPESQQASGEPKISEIEMDPTTINIEPEPINITPNQERSSSQVGPSLDQLYIVQMGAFNNYANAIRLRDELFDKGYTSVHVTEGPPFRVQLRASQTREEAEDLKDEVKEDGYVDVFIVH